MKKALILFISAYCTTVMAASKNTTALLDQIAGADSNRDGNISKAELRTYRAANFERLDRDGNSVLTKSDIPAFVSRLRHAPDFNSLIFQFDADKDGKVTQDEFVNGPTLIFDQADANQDGVLTKAERQAAATKAKP